MGSVICLCRIWRSVFLVFAGVLGTRRRQLLSQTFRALTTVGEIRTLTADEARHARPVRLTGIVTARSGWKNSFFVQDSTAGISVDRTDNADVKVGDQVEITGKPAMQVCSHL